MAWSSHGFLPFRVKAYRPKRGGAGIRADSGSPDVECFKGCFFPAGVGSDRSL